MKPSPLQWLLCTGTLVAALAVAGWLQADSIAATPARPEGQGVKVLPAGMPPGAVPIHFRYHDFAGSLHQFVCWVDGSFARQAEASFGLPLDREATYKELDRRLAREVAKRAGPLLSYARIEVNHDPLDPGAPLGSILWDYRLEERRWGEELPGKEKLPPHLVQEATRFEAWIRKELSGVAGTILGEYYRERGFNLDLPPDGGGPTFAIAYRDIADKTRPMLSNCFDRLVREAGAGDDEQVLGLLLAAMQDIQFQFPPLEDGDLYKAGFWFPTQVLTLGRGDCDSKSGTFCGLWQRVSPQIVLVVIDIPEEEKQRLPPEMRSEQHAFLAIEALPGLNKQKTLKRGLRTYVPFEVVKRIEPGLSKVSPGEQLFDGALRWEVCMTDDCSGTRLATK